MNIKKSISRIAAISIVAISVVGCDHDYETIGSNVIGEPGFDADVYDEALVSATNLDLGPVQTNNLPVHLLGFHNNAVFGPKTASILTQLKLSAPDPEFADGAVLDSVVLKIPYFSREVEPDEDGSKNFELDSILGTAPIKLTIAESGFFLNAYDPETDFQTAQKYYSDLKPQIESNLTGNILYENGNFKPSKAEVVEYGTGALSERDTTYQGPALRVKLSKQFFEQKIINRQGSAVLSNNSNFQNYFRGIYIEAEAVGNDGSLMLLDLANSDAGITLYYSEEVEDTTDADKDEDTAETTKTVGAYKLTFGPAKVNVFEQEAPVFDPDNLYLNGGEGSMAIIDLFSGVDSDSDGISDELEFLRGNEWLINEANLTFYVNRNIMAGSEEPERLYLYDLNNNIRLADYVLESPGEANNAASLANNVHSVPLERDEDKNGIKYKLRITRHIHNLLNNDSTNLRLGLVVTENINLISNSAAKASEVATVPTGSVISPLGTVLHGPDSEDEEKRLKLNIYYTASKE